MKHVKDLEDEKYDLIQDSQDIEFYSEFFGIDLSDYGCLFVWIEDGEITELWGCERYIPYLKEPVIRLVRNGDIVKSNVVLLQTDED